MKQKCLALEHNTLNDPSWAHAFSLLLAGRALTQETRALETKYFQSKNLGLLVFMYAVMMLLYIVWVSPGVLTSAQDFFVSNSQLNKYELI